MPQSCAHPMAFGIKLHDWQSALHCWTTDANAIISVDQKCHRRKPTQGYMRAVPRSAAQHYPTLCPAESRAQVAVVCCRGPRYLEVDVDVGSSRSAASVVGLVQGALKTLVIDIAVLLEGKTQVISRLQCELIMAVLRTPVVISHSTLERRATCTIDHHAEIRSSSTSSGPPSTIIILHYQGFTIIV